MSSWFFAKWSPVASIVIMIYPSSLKTSIYFVIKTLYHTQGNCKYSSWQSIIYLNYTKINHHNIYSFKMILFSLFKKLYNTQRKPKYRVHFKTDVTLNFSCEVETAFFFFLQCVLVFFCYAASCHKLSSFKTICIY